MSAGHYRFPSDVVNAQPNPTRPSTKGPADWFTSDVSVDRIAQGQGDTPMSVGSVHFTPCAHTAWRRQPRACTSPAAMAVGLSGAQPPPDSPPPPRGGGGRCINDGDDATATAPGASHSGAPPGRRAARAGGRPAARALLRPGVRARVHAVHGADGGAVVVG